MARPNCGLFLLPVRILQRPTGCSGGYRATIPTISTRFIYLWYVGRESSFSTRLAIATLRESRRTDLPTWSWVSVYHKCHYNYHHFSPSYQSVSVCDILKSPSGVSPDSEFFSRALVISSKVVDATIRLQESRSDSPLDVEVIVNGKMHTIIADIRQWPEASNEWGNIQKDECLYNGQEVLCLELSTYHLLGNSWCVKVCLVLRELSSAKDTYRQVGIMFINESWKSGIGDVPIHIRHIDQHAAKRTVEII